MVADWATIGMSLAIDFLLTPLYLARVSRSLYLDCETMQTT